MPFHICNQNGWMKGVHVTQNTTNTSFFPSNVYFGSAIAVNSSWDLLWSQNLWFENLWSSRIKSTIFPLENIVWIDWFSVFDRIALLLVQYIFEIISKQNKLLIQKKFGLDIVWSFVRHSVAYQKLPKARENRLFSIFAKVPERVWAPSKKQLQRHSSHCLQQQQNRQQKRSCCCGF